MTEYSKHISSNDQNNCKLKCNFCNSLVLNEDSSTFLNEEHDLPTVSQNKEDLSTNTEKISEWWLVENMFIFENVAFTHTVGTTKYLSCADCELGPIGFHNTDSKKNYIALRRVKHVEDDKKL